MKNILLVADLKGWVFERHCQEIKKRLSGKYNFDIAYCRGDGHRINDMSKKYDLVYVLDPMPISYPPKEKTIIGLRCEWLYDKKHGGPQYLYDTRYKNKCSLMHVVNKRQFNILKDIVDVPLMVVQHGVDETIFDGAKYVKRQNEKLTIACTGRASSDGMKGFNEISNACKSLDVNFITTLYEGKRMSKEEMPLFYSNADVYVCFSETEGLHNPTLEAGAMELQVISTRCGAAEEVISDGTNGILIDRTEKSLVDAILKMKSGELRDTMGKNMYSCIMNKWTWKHKIKEYDEMFAKFLGEI